MLCRLVTATELFRWAGRSWGDASHQSLTSEIQGYRHGPNRVILLNELPGSDSERAEIPLRAVTRPPREKHLPR